MRDGTTITRIGIGGAITAATVTSFIGKSAQGGGSPNPYPNANTSTVSVSAATVALNGTVTITLQAKDVDGNNITTGGASVTFAASGGLSAGTIGATTDVGDGTYTAVFTGTTAGFTATTITATVTGAGDIVDTADVRVYRTPVFVSVSPATGYLGGGTSIVITCTYTDPATTVTIGGSAMTITDRTATTITGTTPAGTAGAQDIVITTAALTDTEVGGFTYYDALFEADFGTDVGTGSNALTDGGAFDSATTNGGTMPVSGDPIIKVVAATTEGINDNWPSTNALRVARAYAAGGTGNAWTEIGDGWAAPGTGESLYFRAYLRVDITTSSGTTENGHHPFEGIDTTGGYWGSPHAWHFTSKGSGKFGLSFWLPSTNSDYKFVLSTSAGVRTDFNTGETYRLEWKLTRAAADSYNVEVRMYDAAGNLLGTSTNSEWRSVFGGTYRKLTSQAWDLGDTHVTKMRFGTNGGTWTNVADEYFYWGGFMVRSDDWCGPY